MADGSRHSHSIQKDGKRLVWYADRLWQLSKNLPVFQYEVASFEGFDEDFWFGDRIKPTICKVMEHHRKIAVADLSHPIIVSETGLIMDGVHRICRAYIDGRKRIPAVKFETNPEPDEILD